MRSVGALYLHVPFCARKCAYCDFLSAATRADDPALDAYVDEQLGLIGRLAQLGLLEDCTTAYIGGGTPTLLGPDRLGRLVTTVRAACPRVEELTCEANPESLSDEVMAAVAGAGATRLSIGVQSLDDAELACLGRPHTSEEAQVRVRAAVASGLDVSVDLMCAVPRQTVASWDRTLVRAVALGVGHVSVYPLVMEGGTPFGHRYGDADTPWNDEDVQAERMERAADVLGDAGYARYEVASYARPGKQCRHNQAYWTGVPYLGLGQGGASMVDTHQYESVRRVYDWLPPLQKECARVRFSTAGRDAEFLSRREAWAEDLMLGMRMTRGVDASLVPQATKDELVARGLARLDEGRMVPTHDGWLLGNELYGVLWDLA